MCEGYLSKLLRTSPMVRFMVKQLAIVGCSPIDDNGGTEDHIMLAKCKERHAGGFLPSPAGVPKNFSALLLCHNAIIDKEHMEATMAHEMMHWYDHCRFKVDQTNLRHIACSEIRANNLSGDCRFWREVINRMNFGFSRQYERCVRRRTIQSMMSNPHGPKDEATANRVVDEVWKSCYNDTRPFDEVYY